jgi:hypothetical protein
MSSKNYNLTISGLLVASGILLPIAFHSFKLGGQIFLPMHLPAFLGGFILPWQFAGAVGLITPFLSFLFTYKKNSIKKMASLLDSEGKLIICHSERRQKINNIA